MSKKFYWYLAGDPECLFGGYAPGPVTLAERLATLESQGDLEATIQSEGGGKGPPGLVKYISEIGMSTSPKRPENVRWEVDDWPSNWKLKCRARDKGNASSLTIEPYAIVLPWPPEGGEELAAEPNDYDARQTQEDAVQDADILMLVVDFLVAKCEGRDKVQAAATNQNVLIRNFDLKPLIQAIDLEAISPISKILKGRGRHLELPSTFSITIDDKMSTRGTWLGVNDDGGVHLQAGWVRETKAKRDPGNDLNFVPGFKILFCPYPCGAIKECD